MHDDSLGVVLGEAEIDQLDIIGVVLMLEQEVLWLDVSRPSDAMLSYL